MKNFITNRYFMDYCVDGLDTAHYKEIVRKRKYGRYRPPHWEWAEFYEKIMGHPDPYGYPKKGRNSPYP